MSDALEQLINKPFTEARRTQKPRVICLREGYQDSGGHSVHCETRRLVVRGQRSIDGDLPFDMEGWVQRNGRRQVVFRPRGWGDRWVYFGG